MPPRVIATTARQPPASGPDPGLAQPYVEATLDVPKESAIPDVPFAKLSEIVAGIIRVERPVSGEAVFERVRILWGKDQLDAADRAALQQALRLASQLQGVAERNAFWIAEDAGEVPPRDRRAAAPHLRRAANVAPAEIEAAEAALAAANKLCVGWDMIESRKQRVEKGRPGGPHQSWCSPGLEGAAQAALAGRAQVGPAGASTPCFWQYRSMSRSSSIPACPVNRVTIIR